MATQSTGINRCGQCASKVAPGLRYCPSCYAPLGGASTAEAHLETTREIATTHRPDPTFIFLPEEHEALIVKKRKRKRLAITVALAFVIVAAGLTGFFLWSKSQQQYKRSIAREQMAMRELNLLADAMERFRADMGRYPTEQEGIQSLTSVTKVINARGAADASNWKGPYMEGIYELDPWGNDYNYRLTDGGAAYILFSNGPEGDSSNGVRLQVTSQERSNQPF